MDTHHLHVVRQGSLGSSFISKHDVGIASSPSLCLACDDGHSSGHVGAWIHCQAAQIYLLHLAIPAQPYFRVCCVTSLLSKIVDLAVLLRASAQSRLGWPTLRRCASLLCGRSLTAGCQQRWFGVTDLHLLFLKRHHCAPPLSCPHAACSVNVSFKETSPCL